jgi:hypothetical protein
MVDALRGVIIIQNLNNQRKKILKSSEIVKLCKTPNAKISKGQMKFVKKKGGLETLEKNLNPKTTLSNKSIGRLLFRSQSSGKLYQKRLNRLGQISSKIDFQVIAKGFIREMLLDLPSKYLINRKGELVLQNSNFISSKYMLSIEQIRATTCFKAEKVAEKKESQA